MNKVFLINCEESASVSDCRPDKMTNECRYNVVAPIAGINIGNAVLSAGSFSEILAKSTIAKIVLLVLLIEA